MIKKTYKIRGMHCASCAMVIEGDLEDAGVKATCSYAKETLEVQLDDETTQESKVVKIVTDAGYTIVTPQ